MFIFSIRNETNKKQQIQTTSTSVCLGTKKKDTLLSEGKPDKWPLTKKSIQKSLNRAGVYL